MRNVRDRSGASRTPRRLDVVRIKLIIVALGAGLSAVISSLTGITPQASFAPMLGWMLGFSASKSQATAMRVTAGIAIASVGGAFWRSSLTTLVDPATDPKLTQFKISHSIPTSFWLTVATLFIGATLGAVLAARAAPRPEMIALRRSFLFSGVCIGMYIAAEGSRFSTLAGGRTAIISGAAALLLLGGISGALTQILGLSSGVILVPALFYFTGLSIQQSILISLAVIGLAALLPAWSYNRRGLGDSQYGAAGLVGGVAVGFVGGVLLIAASTKLLLMLFGLMAMFFSAREISIIASEQTAKQETPSDPV